MQASGQVDYDVPYPASDPKWNTVRRILESLLRGGDGASVFIKDRSRQYIRVVASRIGISVVSRPETKNGQRGYRVWVYNPNKEYQVEYGVPYPEDRFSHRLYGRWVSLLMGMKDGECVFVSVAKISQVASVRAGVLLAAKNIAKRYDKHVMVKVMKGERNGIVGVYVILVGSNNGK